MSLGVLVIFPIYLDIKKACQQETIKIKIVSLKIMNTPLPPKPRISASVFLTIVDKYRQSKIRFYLLINLRLI